MPWPWFHATTLVATNGHDRAMNLPTTLVAKNSNGHDHNHRQMLSKQATIMVYFNGWSPRLWVTYGHDHEVFWFCSGHGAPYLDRGAPTLSHYVHISLPFEALVYSFVSNRILSAILYHFCNILAPFQFLSYIYVIRACVKNQCKARLN